MHTTINSASIDKAVKDTQDAFRKNISKPAATGGEVKMAAYPFPSPADWRDVWIYFLMTDRFNNPLQPPQVRWDQQYNFRQGGIFKGIESQLDYIAGLGAGAIWISPVLKTSRPDFAYNYPGYATQDFLSIEGRFASDGNEATAEKELKELVTAAHAKGLYVILDIVINHTARVFDYNYHNQVTDIFSDESIMDGPLGDEPPIQWLNGFGMPRGGWQNNIPDSDALSPDDAIWPADLRQHKDFFRRRGNKLSDSTTPFGFARGDFGSMRQMVLEYDASAPQQRDIRMQYGVTPVVNILIKAYNQLIAKFDVDGFRIDTVKYVAPSMVQTFGNAIREFALSIGKRNFFTFGEIYDDEKTIAQFVGRNSGDADGFGIDAALDFPLFFKLPAIVKGFADVASIREVYSDRKTAEKNLLSSHGEAGKYFVTFLDNHDQNERFNFPATPKEQVVTGIALLFCLQGIPCLYYGTEQGLDGTKDGNGNKDLGAMESVREAIWGKTPLAFDNQHYFYQHIAQLSQARNTEPALRYGRLYFREISLNGQDFGLPFGAGSIVAFSRVLYTTEIIVVANTSNENSFEGFVVLDWDINRSSPLISVLYSNEATTGQEKVQLVPAANFYNGNEFQGTADTAALFIQLKPMEIQILK